MPLGWDLSRGRLAGLLLGLVVLACPVRAWAQLQSCTAALVPVAFGIYNPRATTDNTSTGSATVNCTGVLGLGVTLLIGYDVRLGPGGSGNTLARQMRNASGRTLNYSLRANSSTGMIWGESNGGGIVTNSGSWVLGLLTPPRLFTIYGRIPARQNVAVGSYSDSVLVTVSF
jgi:spore coat protein U-like protein